MKHVTIVECPEVSLENFDFSKHNIATETSWADFKKFIGFDEESKTQKRIKDLQDTVKDIRSVKSKISQGGSNETVSVNIRKAISSLPVDGDTGSEIGKSLTRLRQNYEGLFQRVQKVKTKEELNSVKDDIRELTSKKNRTPEKITLTKNDLLHFCDEIINVSELEMKILKEGMKIKDSNVSTESYVEAIEAVALEGFFSKLGAILIGFVALVAAGQTFNVAVITLMFAASGAWAAVVGASLPLALGIFTTQFLIEKAMQFWNRE